MQTLIPILYLAAIAAASYFRPIAGLVLACGAYLAGSLTGPGDGGTWINAAGPFISFAVCAAKSVRGKRIIYGFAAADAVMAALFFCILASSLYSKHPVVSFEYAIRFLLLGASFYFFGKLVAAAYQDREALVQDFIWGANIGAMTFAITAVAMNASASQYFLRLTIGESSAIPLAVYLGQGLVATIALILRNQSRAQLTYLLASAAVIGYAFLATNTRSVVIGFGLSVLVLGFSAALTMRAKPILVMLTVCGLIIGGFFFMYMKYPDTISRLVSAASRIGSGQLGESESERVTAWADAWEILSTSPLTGIGSGSFMEIFGLYPHNAFLELGAETGLVGLVLLAALIAMCLKAAIRQSISGKGTLSALFLFHFTVSMVSMSFWMHKLLFLSIAVLLAYEASRKRLIGHSNSPT